MEAVWILDYDHTTDNCYHRPGCPECNAPAIMYEDGEYKCVSCQQPIEVNDTDMQKWFKAREGEKVVMEDCPQYEIDGCVYGCGGKRTVETHYFKNDVTLKWQAAWGQCNKCGRRFIV